MHLLLSLLCLTAATGDDITTEVLRKRAHLEEVIAELSQRQVDELSPAQLEMRARCLDLLKAYQERAMFPQNCDFARVAMPYFVDQAGARCAVAHLMENT